MGKCLIAEPNTQSALMFVDRLSRLKVNRRISPVGGENVDHRMFWATPAMMNRLIPLPSPQPFWTSSSINMTIMPAAINWMKITSITGPARSCSIHAA